MDIPPHSVKGSPVNPLKRKRELLPLGTPPSQPTPVSPSFEPRPILRANRACNACRRQKIRCDGPDSQPCSRCKAGGLECIFEKVPPQKVVSTTSRIESLEKAMETVQATQIQMNSSIQEILYELRRRPVARTPPAISVDDPLDQGKPAPHSSLETKSSFIPSFTPLGTPGTPFSPAKILEESHPITSPPLSGHTTLPPFKSLLTPFAISSEYSSTSSSLSRTPIFQDNDGSLNYLRPSSVAPASLQSTQQAFSEPWRPLDTSMTQRSPSPNVVDHPKAHSVHSRNFNDASTKSEIEINDKTEGGITPQDHVDFVPGTGDRRTLPEQRRLDARNVLREDSGSRVWNPDDYIKEFRVEDATCPDAVDKGLLTETEARDMFALFFERCHPRMPIFDPKTDGFRSLRQCSPFCFCCILMVAVKARDGGKQPSTLQRSLWEEAMLRAKESMFHRVKDLEVIQGLLLLSAWSESTGGTSWILAGHAIRCAVELGIHKSLGKLVNETTNDENAVHIIVCSARVWCALFAFEYQLSLGIGRFTMIGSPKTIKNARETLLRHPLSTPSDMRLVSACEIMTLEYHILESLPNADADDPRCQIILEEGRSRMDVWYAEWDTMLSTFYSQEHYMRQTIAVQRYFGYMTVHLACMPRNVAAADVVNLSQFERENCVRAISAARDIVRISVESHSYREGLQYSPPCFYGGVSFVGSLILRLGCVLPGEQEHILSLAKELCQVLQDVPTCRFKFQFMTLLKESEQN